MKFLPILLSLCPLTTMFAQTTSDTLAVEKGVSHQLAEYRFKTIHQLAYKVFFNIPPQKSAAIAGVEDISFALTDTSQPLQIDFRQDANHINAITVNGQTVPTQLVNEHLLVQGSYLRKGGNVASINFTAGNESLNRYDDYLYALFVPDRARTVFPCFDQPDLKAIFTLRLTVPKAWAVLGNAPVKDSLPADSATTYSFAPSDKIPTYLFSFTAGKYTVATKPWGRLGMRFLYRETDTAKIRLSTDLVFSLHRDAITFLQGWTGIPFPFQKVGFVGIPSFQFGGMEHPGEVQYNAPALFLDQGATKDQLVARASVISHETAHMWFGDMVTMKWFNDVWMKEVFANFMADKVTEKLMGEETFNLKFLQDHYPAAYGIDRTAGANPIRQQLDNLQDAGSLYGNIIYHKAPVMMRQLEALMGRDNFRQGVREYLQKYKYGNATWPDLITILSAHTTQDLLTWNKVWVNRPGRPVFDYLLDTAHGKIKSFTITQHPETGPAAVWPQRFAVTLIYDGFDTTFNVNMTKGSVTVTAATGMPKPFCILFNSNGMGYGLFPVDTTIGVSIFDMPPPVLRASHYINMYENMLAGRVVKPERMLAFLKNGLLTEENEMNLRLLAGYTTTIFWEFLSPVARQASRDRLEKLLWAAMEKQTQPNNKKILFKAYQDVYTSSEAASRMYAIWQNQKAPDGVTLTEDDYTALALTIALKTDTANQVLAQQQARVTNADRKARLQFLMPALSPDSTVRDSFFSSLKILSNRRKEAWVAAGLAYLNHPLRQQTFAKHLRESLDMLQDVQLTGDVFFPQNWLGAIFGSCQSKQAWQTVQEFLNSHPAYNPKLKAKILQATDNLYRAQGLVGQ